MATVKEEAQVFEATTKTKNIAELPAFNLSNEMKTFEGVDKDGKEFRYKYIEIEGEKYRVPYKVLGDIKNILEVNPNVNSVRVVKKGTDLQTQYTVVPLGIGAIVEKVN